MIPIASPIIGSREVEAVTKVLRSASLAQGAEVFAFEEEFSQFVGNRTCVAVNSGTSALHLALLSLGIGPGDEVIVPSFTFAATANSVRLAGAVPVFVDIDDSFCIDPIAARNAITDRTAAIMPVHLYGQPAEMLQLTELARDNNLLIIEDAAQAHLATHQLGPVGALGDAAAFSFYPTKNMTSGEGGMIVFKEPANARTAQLLRNQGMERRYANEIVGFNLRMTDIHAAIGRVQLSQLETWTSKRQENADFMTRNLENVVAPSARKGSSHVFHQYTIRVNAQIRDALSEGLLAEGVGNAVYYPTPVHRLPSYGLCERCPDPSHPCSALPETDRASQECLSLPVHPNLTLEDLTKIVDSVNRLSGSLR